MTHAKKQRRKENREPVCVMLGAERWVSRSVVNRADARGGIWDVEVVEEIIGRPLHHTLRIEAQQVTSSGGTRRKKSLSKTSSNENRAAMLRVKSSFFAAARFSRNGSRVRIQER